MGVLVMHRSRSTMTVDVREREEANGSSYVTTYLLSKMCSWISNVHVSTNVPESLVLLSLITIVLLQYKSSTHQVCGMKFFNLNVITGSQLFSMP